LVWDGPGAVSKVIEDDETLGVWMLFRVSPAFDESKGMSEIAMLTIEIGSESEEFDSGGLGIWTKD
jgi:hypothetical protein